MAEKLVHYTCEICGEIDANCTGTVSNLLAIGTSVTASTRGGFWGGIGKEDGSLTSYAGNIIG